MKKNHIYILIAALLIIGFWWFHNKNKPVVLDSDKPALPIPGVTTKEIVEDPGYSDRRPNDGLTLSVSDIQEI